MAVSHRSGLTLLSGIGAQVATALERARLYDISNDQRLRLEEELNMAREVQRSLLSQQLPEIPGYCLVAGWYSACEMAGDFYDVFLLPDGKWGLVMADVADKGAAAALYMAMTSSLIRASSNNLSSPAEILMEVNQRILAHCSSEMFVTVFYGLLDAVGRELTYANAGHNPALLGRLSREIKLLNPTGAAIGIFED